MTPYSREPLPQRVPSYRLPLNQNGHRRGPQVGFYEKVVKVKANVAAILKFFLPMPQIEADHPNAAPVVPPGTRLVYCVLALLQRFSPLGSPT